MRRKTGLIGAALFALVSVMPVWAIWEGNAGIAASSEFTQAGFFAKSDMFPKNTLVEIENLDRITSYNVCYTKLLRFRPINLDTIKF